MNNRFAFVAGLAVSALAFGCVAAVAAPTEEAPAEEAPAPLTYEETAALFGESFAVGDVIVCPEGWTVATDTTAEGFHWAACM